MSYIGLEPSHGSFDKQLITGDGSTATFTLEFPVAQAGQLLVSLDGIIQEPSFSYNISLYCKLLKLSFWTLEFEKCVIIYSKSTEEIDEISSRTSSSSFLSSPNLFIPVSMCKILFIFGDNFLNLIKFFN